MKCYANRVTTRLLNTPPATPATTTQTGAGYRVLPEQSDGQSDAVQDFKFVSSLVLTGGASSPTGQLVIQGSVDGFSWVDVVFGTVRTEAGTYFEALDSTSAGLMPWVRAKLVLAGGTSFGAVATVDLLSTGPFTLSSS